MKHIKEYHDDYTWVEITSDIYREIPKKKMDDYTMQYIQNTVKYLTDDYGIREDGTDNSIEYWDVKTFKSNVRGKPKATKISIFESDDEYFYIIIYHNYRSICYKCDQLSGLSNCINNGYGI